MGIIARLFAVLLSSGALSAAAPPQDPPTFNAYVLRAVQKVSAERSGGGYDLHKAFTQDLTYGADCCVSASRPKKDEGVNPTMCVAGVAEVIIEAMNLYYREQNGAHPEEVSRVFGELPRASWTAGSLRSLRAHVFMYGGTGSAGSASAFAKFRMGRQKDFPDLNPGDVMNFNRAATASSRATGHAVIFMGYLERSGSQLSFDRQTTVGFRYFSAQGKGRPDGGFGYRNAYFAGHCPEPRGRNDDCNVIKAFSWGPDGKFRQNQDLLNSGELYYPSRWRVSDALAAMSTGVSRGLEGAGLTRGAGLEEALQATLNRELQPEPDQYEDGSEL